MRCACIDIGSNTTRLLVAEPSGDGLREVLAERRFTRFGAGDGAIPAPKIREIAEAVAAQALLARECGAGRIRAVATAAIRDAPNGDELCAAVAAASGVEVAVLSGDDEARLAFAGATAALHDGPAGTVAVVDVGGGSTEIVCGTLAGGATWAASLKIGSGVLADRWLRSDPPAAAELEAVRDDVARTFDDLETPPAAAAYAVGGSATSLRRLIGPLLDRETLGRAIRVVSEAPAEEVARRFDLHLERVRVLPAGLVLLDAASALLGLALSIAAGGLREGVILEQLGEAG